MSAQLRVNSLGPSAKTMGSVRRTEDGTSSEFRLALSYLVVEGRQLVNPLRSHIELVRLPLVSNLRIRGTE